MISYTNKKLYIYIFIYYILLLLLYISWSDIYSVPNGAIRIAYLIAVLIPVFLWDMKLVPAVIILFYSLALNGYTSSYLPVMEYSYIVPTLVGVFFVKRKSNNQLKIPSVLLLLFFISFTINGIKSFTIEDISITLFLIIVLSLYLKKDNIFQLSSLSLVIIILSFILSLTYFLYGSNFAIEYKEFGGERVGFADINYVGCIIGFGSLLAIMEFFKKKKTPLLYKLFLIITILISVIALFLNASRGSILALGVGFIVLVLLSKKSTTIKLISLCSFIILMVYLYTNNYMDLLIYRINTDDTGGSGRTDIWISKLNLWGQSESFSNLIFGYGYIGGRKLGVLGQVAFHNDFLAFLVEYGIIGLCIFIYFIMYPIFGIYKENRAMVFACLSYLIVVCMTLEPFAAGRLPFYAFWLYIYYLSRTRIYLNH